MILACVHATKASGQVVDNLGFKALPRAIHYDTPLVPKQGPKAVIVYGKNAPYTQTAAQALQKAIQEWCGVALGLVDDRTVTSDQTWLLTEAYLKVPLVVLGNAQDNRAMHALGTRYLLASNRTWPGGDRYIVRSYLEPFGRHELDPAGGLQRGGHGCRGGEVSPDAPGVWQERIGHRAAVS